MGGITFPLPAMAWNRRALSQTIAKLVSQSAFGRPAEAAMLPVSQEDDLPKQSRQRHKHSRRPSPPPERAGPHQLTRPIKTGQLSAQPKSLQAAGQIVQPDALGRQTLGVGALSPPGENCVQVRVCRSGKDHQSFRAVDEPTFRRDRKRIMTTALVWFHPKDAKTAEE